MTTPESSGPEPDEAFLQRAVVLGRRGWGRVHPNPMVGCVIARDGVVVGEGWHESFGGPHAEVVALEQAGGDAEGATAYVSLEPCRHHGKTPPCTDALREAGVARVVYGARDPGTRSAGGADVLRASGVEVRGPLHTPEEGYANNPAFFHRALGERPYVALKLAATLDGRIAEAPGRRTAITGEAALRRVQWLRRGHDAVLVGSGTVRADDPELTLRPREADVAPPIRVVLDSDASLTSDSKLVRGVAEAPVLVVAAEGAPESDVERLRREGVTVELVPRGPAGLDLQAALGVCAERRLTSILCEGGARLAASLVEEGLAGRLYLFVAPFTLGPSAVPAFGGEIGREAWTGWYLSRLESLDADVLITYDRPPGS